MSVNSPFLVCVLQMFTECIFSVFLVHFGVILRFSCQIWHNEAQFIKSKCVFL